MLDQTSNTELTEFGQVIYKQKYSLDGQEEWPETAFRVTFNVMGALGYKPGDPLFEEILRIITERKFIPGGRYLYAAGRPLHQVNNCFLVKAEDSREGWADLAHKSLMVLQTGGGLGVDYSDIREYGAPIRKTGGIASGPLPLMQMINEMGRGVMQGGSRRSALIALLNWDHPDCFDFIHCKDWSDHIKAAKLEDGNAFAPMDMTNISINLNDEFFDAIRDPQHSKHQLATRIYDEAISNGLATGEPGFSVNIGDQSDEILRNPCGEVTSADDSDVCNLGSINLAKIEDEVELEEVTDLATLFLLAGTVYSHIPYEKVGEIRAKNRRIGLGLMGVHEWLLKRNLPYEPNDELGKWLSIWEEISDRSAQYWANQHNLSEPIAKRAIAPAGTIGIIGGTTTGIEPIFCVAYKRRYLTEGTKWKYQYVVDPTAHRLIEEYGVDPSNIEDAYSLSYNIEKRIFFQAWVQQYVDMGISSTVNLPYSITDKNEIDDMKEWLVTYLPSLRGITFYPDGARGNQPLVPSTYEEAIKHQGVVFEEDVEHACKDGVCGA